MAQRRTGPGKVEKRPPVPPPGDAVTKEIEVSAKSFIALIGSNTGSIPGVTIVPVPAPPPAPPAVPAPRQVLLVALVKATDANFNENPGTIVKDKHYRLFSSCRFKIVFQNNKILDAVQSALDTDVGKEGPLQPSPLITTPVIVTPAGDSAITFSWFGKGRPHWAAEPAFQEVLPRTSVFIWHIVEGRIDVSSGTPVTTVTIRGSRFPSHRVFVDGVVRPPGQRQGPFSNLWVRDPGDSTKVK